jgi:hypothetical protein
VAVVGEAAGPGGCAVGRIHCGLPVGQVGVEAGPGGWAVGLTHGGLPVGPFPGGVTAPGSHPLGGGEVTSGRNCSRATVSGPDAGSLQLAANDVPNHRTNTHEQFMVLPRSQQ